MDLNNAKLRQNAGGYYNHTLYFNILSPKEQTPKDTLAGSINKEFGSFANLTNQFKGQSIKQFGSGWAWLSVDKNGKLFVSSTPNQDNPLMKNALIPGTKLFCCLTFKLIRKICKRTKFFINRTSQRIFWSFLFRS